MNLKKFERWKLLRSLLPELVMLDCNMAKRQVLGNLHESSQFLERKKLGIWIITGQSPFGKDAVYKQICA
jgi:hypothetical protein